MLILLRRSTKENFLCIDKEFNMMSRKKGQTSYCKQMKAVETATDISSSVCRQINTFQTLFQCTRMKKTTTVKPPNGLFSVLNSCTFSLLGQNRSEWISLPACCGLARH